MPFQKLIELYKSEQNNNLECGLNILSRKSSNVSSKTMESVEAQEQQSSAVHLESIDLVNRNNSTDEQRPGTSSSTSANKSKHDDNVNDTVFVGNISFRGNKNNIKRLFSQFGKVTGVYIAKDHATRKAKGRYAFVTFSNHVEAVAAVNASQTPLVEFQGRSLRIFWSNEKRLKKFKKEMDEATSNRCLSYEKEGETTSRILNDDSVLLIFSYLNLEELMMAHDVCVRWRRLVGKCLAAKRKLDFHDSLLSFSNTFIDTQFKQIIMYCAPNLMELDMSSLVFLVDYKTVELIANFCCNLVKVDFSHSRLTDTQLKILASKCTKLKEVVLCRCNDFGEKGLWWLVHKLPGLTHLDISENDRITGKCFNRMGTVMEKIVFNKNTKMSSYGYSTLAFKCKNLKELHLKAMVSLDDASFTAICKECVTLRKLVVNSSTLSSSGIAKISTLPFLEELDISQNYNLDSSALVQIAHGCPNLRILNISGSSSTVCDLGVQSFVHCRHLTDLNISYIKTVTDESLSKLARIGRLERVTARGCSSISQGSCVDLLAMCPRLQLLDLSSCINVGEAILEPCLHAVQARNDSLPLTVVIGGTAIDTSNVQIISHPLLKLDIESYCNSRWNYIDEMDDFGFDQFDEYGDYDDDYDDYEDDYDDYDDGGMMDEDGPVWLIE